MALIREGLLKSIINLLSFFDLRRVPDSTDSGRNLRIVLAFWGSFESDGTIGDEVSAKSLFCSLVKNGYSVDVISWKDLNWANAIKPTEVEYRKYSKFIFVCGPVIPHYQPLIALLANASAAGCITIGFSVSLFKKSDGEIYNPFDIVFPRESEFEVGSDLAVLEKTSAQPVKVQNIVKVGLVLRGWQKEYGPDNCYWKPVEEVIKEALDLFGRDKSVEIKIIDHQLYRSKWSIEEYDLAYNSCDLLITTRFHGAIFAIRNNVPFLAIDQIRPFAKVTRLLQHIDYPFKFSYSNFDLKVCLDFLNANHLDTKAQLELIRISEEKKASNFLNQLYVAIGE